MTGKNPAEKNFQLLLQNTAPASLRKAQNAYARSNSLLLQAGALPDPRRYPSEDTAFAPRCAGKSLSGYKNCGISCICPRTRGKDLESLFQLAEKRHLPRGV